MQRLWRNASLQLKQAVRGAGMARLPRLKFLQRLFRRGCCWRVGHSKSCSRDCLLDTTIKRIVASIPRLLQMTQTGYYGTERKESPWNVCVKSQWTTKNRRWRNLISFGKCYELQIIFYLTKHPKTSNLLYRECCR